MDKNLFSYQGSKQVFSIIVILTAIQAGAIIVQGVYLAKAIIGMYDGEPWSKIVQFFLIFIIALLLRQSIQWAKSKIAYRFAEKTARHYQNLLISKLFKMGPREISKHGSGNMITLGLEGIPSFRTYLELFIPRFVSVIIIPIILFFYVFQLDKLSGIILLVVLPVLFAFFILLGLAAQKEKNNKWANYRILANHFVDSLRGIVTLKYLGKSKEHKESIAIVSDKFRVSTMRTLRIAFLSTFSLDFFSTLSVAVVAVFLGLRLIEGEISFLPALIVLILAPEYFTPVRELSNDYHATMDGKEAGNNIHRILEQEDQMKFKNVSVKHWNEDSTLILESIEKDSEKENRTLLHEINLIAKGFKKIGIIGLSGAGKSTLIDILSGFSQPSRGKIYVDGVELEDLSIAGWQEQINYIPQHPYIFSGTLAENVAWYAPEATKEEIEHVIKLAGLNELVNQLPNGIHEKIGQGGRILSGGEEQRIALARALLKPRPILILDEPTAHLDIETEHDLKQRMLPVFEEKLVFLATHRLHWMPYMDEIFVLDQGRIVEKGTHTELLQKNGAYYELVCAYRGGTVHETLSKVH